MWFNKDNVGTALRLNTLVPAFGSSLILLKFYLFNK